MPGTPPQPLLRVSELAKSYPGVQALSAVTLDFHRGEVHALMGENGAGKSTFARVVAGQEQPDAGRMVFNDRPYAPSGKPDAEQLGIRIVMQELNLVPTLSVAENIFLNRLPASLGIINRRRLRHAASEIMTTVGLGQTHPDTPVGTLGVGQQQMVEIAAGLSQRCKLLILDEPTAALTDSEISLLFRQIAKLKREGVCIIYISHRMEEIRRISDRITVLRDGRLRGTRDAAHAPISEIIRLMIGRDLDTMPDTGRPSRDRPALRVENLRRGDRVRGVSFELFQGEILGFSGMMGSGRTELMRLIFGADRRDAGDIYLHGATSPKDIRSPSDAVRAGIALLTEDRKAQGLLLPLSVAANCSLAHLRPVARLGWIQPRAERAVADRLVAELTIKCRSVHQEVRTLSGGNQQKVVIARWLHRNPEILIFDEPTRGIDVGAKFEIHNLLAKLAAEGRAIIVVSSEMPELFALCDRIAVMSNGLLAACFNRGDWSQDKVMEAALSGYSSP